MILQIKKVLHNCSRMFTSIIWQKLVSRTIFFLSKFLFPNAKLHIYKLYIVIYKYIYYIFIFVFKYIYIYVCVCVWVGGCDTYVIYIYIYITYIQIYLPRINFTEKNEINAKHLRQGNAHRKPFWFCHQAPLYKQKLK